MGDITQVIKELTLEKIQAEEQAQTMAQMVSALALMLADDKGVVRISKAIQNQIPNTNISTEILKKTGAIKLTIIRTSESD
ncbi:MAG: hypothetical protein ACW99J_18610 [Candidatus Thorarchaeota archaeon]|jgi:UDP-N-acetyl-D-mannosaminuronic acid transferase (WecB/TagA/CpsF family)